ncbi:abortive infection system antitoxin AbiGi family protein [Shewanella algae]|uniref:abortive infection system antitoxin AbiGi family protein n=1 Tax=Shewanella algae TaxID=38313 RepID=UPI001C581B00
MKEEKELVQGKSLYPEILFHFSGKEALLAILESTFRVSYAREKIIGKEKTREIGVPMISFCDLRLSEVSTHMCKYGNYGIGLTKEWANRNGLNPVLYISKHSPFTDGLITGLDKVHTHIRNHAMHGVSDTDAINTAYLNIYNVYRYIKNYEAPLHKKGYKKIDKYRFADEREWRYVPPLENAELAPFVPIARIKTSSQKEELNRSISHVNLHFEPEDIRYLIVENDNEISELIEHLESVKGRFSPQVLNRLKSRILTLEQIESDI